MTKILPSPTFPVLADLIIAIDHLLEERIINRDF